MSLGSGQGALSDPSWLLQQPAWSRRVLAAVLEPLSLWAAAPAQWDIGHPGTMAGRRRGTAGDRACPWHGATGASQDTAQVPIPSSHLRVAPGFGVGLALGLTCFVLTHIPWRQAQIQA